MEAAPKERELPFLFSEVERLIRWEPMCDWYSENVVHGGDIQL